jgi:hypothetical protein
MTDTQKGRGIAVSAALLGVLLAILLVQLGLAHPLAWIWEVLDALFS